MSNVLIQSAHQPLRGTLEMALILQVGMLEEASSEGSSASVWWAWDSDPIRSSSGLRAITAMLPRLPGGMTVVTGAGLSGQPLALAKLSAGCHQHSWTGWAQASHLPHPGSSHHFKEPQVRCTPSLHRAGSFQRGAVSSAQLCTPSPPYVPTSPLLPLPAPTPHPVSGEQMRQCM